MHHETNKTKRPYLFRLLTIAILTTGSFLLLTALLVSPSTWADSANSDELVTFFSNTDQNCYYLNPDPPDGEPTHAVSHSIYLTLPYSGTVEQATLLLRSTNVRIGQRSSHLCQWR